MNISDIVFVEITNGKTQVNRPHILILMGLQYSGKSWLAEKISDNNYAHFWATNIKKQYNIKNPDMIDLATLLIEKTINAKFNIVIDYVNHTYAIRKRFEEIAIRLGIDYEVVYLDISKDIRLIRRNDNLLQGDKKGRRLISLEQMQQFENEFEEPNTNEHAIVLKNTNDIEKFIYNL